MVTLKDIAARCGLSIATVSKALNNMSDISPATIRRVQSVAAEMGYLPNAAARSMKTGRSMTIGLLWFFNYGSLWENEYFTRIAASIQATMDAQGYDITPVNCNGASIMGSWLNYCRYRNYDGLIIMSGSVPSSSLMDLINSDFPIVTIDNTFPNRSAVMTDGADSLYRLVKYVYEKGHRRIGYIHGEACLVTRTRMEGFRRACGELGLTIDERYIREAMFHDGEACSRETEALLRLPDPPTCIFYPDDYAAFGAMHWLKDHGYRIPEDISIVGYDGIQLASSIQPKLVTFRQDCANIGTMVAQLLLENIATPRDLLPKHISLPGIVMEGGSVADMN